MQACGRGLEYRFTNNGRSPVEAVFSFNARNFMAIGESATGSGGRTADSSCGRTRIRRSRGRRRFAAAATDAA